MPDRIAVLYSVVTSLGRGEPGDLLPDKETAAIAVGVTEALRREGMDASLHPVRNSSEIALVLAGMNPKKTVVFNLCEALGGVPSGSTTATGEILAAETIIRAGFRCTGASPAALARCLDKGLTHEILAKAGVPVAPAQLFTRPDDHLRIPYPVIVKPAQEDCSLAIRDDSVVDNDRDLRERVGRLIDTFRQPALVEKFLNGREFSVSIWGNAEPEVAGTGQIDFSSCDDPRRRLETFENKWSDRFPGVYPAGVSEQERAWLSDLGRTAYRAMDCQGYGRVDVREDSGEFYVLEVNPNPSLAKDAGFARASEASGIPYGAMLRRIVGLASRPD
ncbi:MAG TPA: ATP-grasp domain-containing protein [Spirochaetia bacterium]|nr:ATP-grasp domain-containing protein [Spirochaetia bacterium]